MEPASWCDGSGENGSASTLIPTENYNLLRKNLVSHMAKSKSMTGNDGGRKLASGHGRSKRKTGGEAQKKRTVPRGLGRRTGSSKELG
jgi:hypothetical protein